MISNPIKPGHTFSGWQDVFSVMPASDVEINGYFTINKYRVTFKDIHGEVIYSEEVNWNHPATSITAPVEEGYDFIAFDKDISKITSDLEVN